MDTLEFTIREADPCDARLSDLFSRHLSFARATSPACSVHSQEPGDLAHANATLFAVEHIGRPIAICALVALDEAGHAEIKSMHVSDTVRGQGVGRSLLDHVIEAARDAGFRRLSLETGSQPGFEPARQLYLSAGFQVTDPFGSYSLDDNSVYMTRVL